MLYNLEKTDPTENSPMAPSTSLHGIQLSGTCRNQMFPKDQNMKKHNPFVLEGPEHEKT